MIAGFQVDDGHISGKLLLAQQGLQQFGVAKQGGHPGRLQLVYQFSRRQPRVERHQHPAAGRHGVDQLDKLRAVPGQHRYPIARRTTGGQTGCNSLYPLLQRRVARWHAAPPQGDPFGLARRLCGNQLL